MDDTLELAERAAAAGGRVARDSFRQAVETATKAHKNDLVSAADEAAQERVVEVIRAETDAPIVGEEEGQRATVPASGHAWIVDPIDGTANYLRGLRVWTTSVAAVEDGQPVAGVSVMPALDDRYVAGTDSTRLNGTAVTVSDRTDVETFAAAPLGWGPHGERDAYARLSSAIIQQCGDMRRFGSMQSALAAVASGGLDAAITTGRPNPWDAVAGAHMVRQAGGRVTDLDGEPWRYDSPELVVSNGRAHEAVLEVAREALT